MKHFSFLALVTALFLSGIISGCGGGGGGAQPASVQIIPRSGTVPISETLDFTATVSDTSNQTVTWAVVETGGGTINANGVYTAPATAGLYHVPPPVWPSRRSRPRRRSPCSPATRSSSFIKRRAFTMTRYCPVITTALALALLLLAGCGEQRRRPAAR